MNFTGSNCNSNSFGNDTCGCQKATYQQCNQVVQTCDVEDVPHYMNYHTHVVNNHVIRHVNIPTYSTSEENVYVNEYVQGQPIYQQPVFYNQQKFEQLPNMQQPTFQQPFGQQNVGYQGMVNPFNTPFGF